MPCYNESPVRVMAGLQAIWESLRDAGNSDAFDIFILSDTTNPDTWIEEEAAFLALRRRTGSERIFYRRRKKNIARKAGNIADWVTRWGGAYPSFLILDADSVMRGETLLRLVGAMETHPDVGIIQTLPIITGGATLFARMQQFAGRVYGPLIAHGIAWWHGAEGNYWGHNAMIRTRAFAEQAGLPELQGRKPFGGHILSHDFVEAALIRRAGWAVHMVPALAGSYEESPPDLTDLAVRDRRWCQGNLQHLAVLPARGLHWVSRLHLLTGIGSYITAPLWLMFMLAGIMIALRDRFVLPDYFPAGKALFPVWPVVDPVRAMWMFVGTMALLLIPKASRLYRRAGAGPRSGAVVAAALRLLFGLLLETLLSGLIAPVVMLTQCDRRRFDPARAAIRAGTRNGRDGGAAAGGDVARLYRSHTLLGDRGGRASGLVGLAAAGALDVAGRRWPCALAIPLVALTSRRTRALGLLRIPEEVQPPSVLARASRCRANSLPRADTVSGARSSAARPEHCSPRIAPCCRPRASPWIEPPEIPLLTGRAHLEEAPTLPLAWARMTTEERAACLAGRTRARRDRGAFRFAMKPDRTL